MLKALYWITAQCHRDALHIPGRYATGRGERSVQQMLTPPGITRTLLHTAWLATGAGGKAGLGAMCVDLELKPAGAGLLPAPQANVEGMW